MSRKALAKVDAKNASANNIPKAEDQLTLKPVQKRKMAAAAEQENLQPETATPTKPVSQKGKKAKAAAPTVVEPIVIDGPVAARQSENGEHPGFVNVEKYNKLKERFDALKELRETEMEKLYYENQRTWAAKDAASQALIESLKQDKDRLAESARENSDAGTLVRFYARLTGLTVQRVAGTSSSVNGSTISGSDDESFSCRYVRRDSALDFELVLRPREAQVEYCPRTPLEPALKALPEYLSTDIVFAEHELPAFLSKIQAHMARLLP